MKDNKLIAEFMGLKDCKIGDQKGKKYDYYLTEQFELIKEVETTIESNWCEVLEEQDCCFIEDLKFHSSWDWLMPVVEKIERLGYEVVISRISCNINGILDRKNPITSIVCGDISKKMDITYDSIVEFIKWYNKNEVVR